ncbi:hypothetical protein CGG82_17860 [Vibrio parahaemolyticus]|uniref:hypothetical protein n=1 Tax=Vibrio parahaemolyticus TaxID=670 RepID=UPI001122A8BA|nr:hypothetical protein [Vibrio parahaemolyticus]TOR11912.1 hypothetical protein CGG82_17860 [Vibrio parahaemolyticus]UJW92758.1 hypothetical protein JHS83_25360 [Vibrio parahaemolyticus]UJX06923.1 hypothetical protein JHS88_25010 [Vibrio parahaemolyticus]UJX07032.1 hypothetical protein JHS88_25200 [Vibrio parahaemolyticus]WCZ09836.1 hypothetical protein GSR97_26690 [Vibrio parahaemolyticus]
MKKSLLLVIVSLLTISSASHALTGKEVEEQLNFQINNIVTECDDGAPAWMCSGVIIRVSEGHSPTWEPSEVSQIENQSVAASLIRSDIPSMYDALWPVAQYGTIYASNVSPSESGVSVSLLCAYPLDGFSAGSSSRGCGVYLSKLINDYSSCEAAGVYNSTDWLVKYGDNGYGYGCSFSSIQTDYFIESIRTQIEVINQGETEFWNEMVVDTENMNFLDVYSLPIKALFFKESGLWGAQTDQVIYLSETGKCIPIVELIKNSDGSNAAEPFVYDAENQISECQILLGV